MKYYKQRMGRAGEDIASKYLEKQGLEILFKNYRTKLGEIDIIARDQDTIVFVEVRTRIHEKHGHPLETINLKKKNKLIRTARFFLIDKLPGESTATRFDIISIKTKPNMEILHIKNAFEVE